MQAACWAAQHRQDEGIEHLLQQGENLALVGRLRKAETLFEQAWRMAMEQDSDLANSAAWELAFLLMRMEAYAEAGEWFSRVAHQPWMRDGLWDANRQALTRMCESVARLPVEAAAAPAARLVCGPAPATDALPQLFIHNLGRFQIFRAGQLLPVCKARKAAMLLRYLLTRPHRSAHRDELVEVLRPEAQPDKSLHSLHVTASALRRYLNPLAGSYLIFEAGWYAINADAPVDDDCSTFLRLCDAAEQHRQAGERAVAQQCYADAAACYHGDYDIDDLQTVWAVAERERLFVRYLSVLDHAGRMCIEQRQFEHAADYYMRLLDHDAYREDAHYQLMQCYVQLGRRGTALRQYERCTDVLARDLGLEPMPELKELYHTILYGVD